MTDAHLPEHIRKARAEEAATYPPHVIYAGGIDHYQAGQSQGLHDAILRADWNTVRQIAADPYTAGDDVDMAAGALAGACEPLTAPAPAAAPFVDAHRLAPLPATRDEATKHAWVRYYAAQALAAHATLHAKSESITPDTAPGSRPDIGYLAMVAQSSMAAAAAFLGPNDAPGLVWDLTPELGALNGEWEEWLTDVLVRYGVNPGHIDPAYNAADFAEAVRR